ncbi:hypothetical protein [Burkholderia cenocepacia]|uniref:hypothetical protein n=1 Tax=Burkholderia cenocepacia TaxID=95486 RepID=UPI0013DF4A7F|nr:hypothetical protein [Burkholderia cenocepacia]
MTKVSRKRVFMAVGRAEDAQLAGDEKRTGAGKTRGSVKKFYTTDAKKLVGDKIFSFLFFA